MKNPFSRTKRWRRAGLLAMAGSIFVGVYFGARVGIGLEAREQRPFILWVVNRLLFLSSVGSIQGFAQYFMSDVLKLGNAATMTTTLLALVALFLIPSAIFGGTLADKMGRKRLIEAAGLIAALGTFILLFARNIPLVMVSGCIIGRSVRIWYPKRMPVATWVFRTWPAPGQVLWELVLADPWLISLTHFNRGWDISSYLHHTGVCLSSPHW